MSSKLRGHQKRPWRQLRTSTGLQDCFEDTATFFPNLQCRCTAFRFRFSRMRGTWRSQVPCIRENRKRTAVHRHCKLGKKVAVSSRRSSWPCRPPRPSDTYRLHTCICTLYIPPLAYIDKKPCKIRKKDRGDLFYNYECNMAILWGPWATRGPSGRFY